MSFFITITIIFFSVAYRKNIFCFIKELKLRTKKKKTPPKERCLPVLTEILKNDSESSEPLSILTRVIKGLYQKEEVECILIMRYQSARKVVIAQVFMPDNLPHQIVFLGSIPGEITPVLVSKLTKQVQAVIERTWKNEENKYSVQEELVDFITIDEAEIYREEVLPTIQVEEITTEEIQSKVIELRKTPKIVCGILTRSGISAYESSKGKYDVFSVTIRMDDGSEETLKGANLQSGLIKAKAAIGDHIEVIKVGRKTMEEGKAPMSLYHVSKLN